MENNKPLVLLLQLLDFSILLEKEVPEEEEERQGVNKQQLKNDKKH